MFPPCIKILVRDSDISDNRHQHRHFPIKSLNIFSRPSTSLAAFFCAFCVDRQHAVLRNGANIPINTSSAAAEGRRCCSPTAEDMHKPNASCSPPRRGDGELRGSRNRRRRNGKVFGARPAEPHASEAGNCGPPRSRGCGPRSSARCNLRWRRHPFTALPHGASSPTSAVCL